MVTITISGTPGSGKSTVAQLLHKKLGIRYIYSGMIFRDLARKYKMALEKFGEYCEKNDDVDRELDRNQLRILKEGNVILEGRLAGWLAYLHQIPALKILIVADVDTRAKRIVKREGGTVTQRKQEILKREKSERKRYKMYYDIDVTDTSIYDLVIDSTDKTPEEIVEQILERIST